MIEVDLRLGQELKTLSFQRRLLGVTDTTLDLCFAVWVAAGHRDDVVVGEHVAEKRVNEGIVDIGGDNTPSVRLSSTTYLVVPPRRLKAVSCSSAQICELDWKRSRQTHLRLNPRVETKSRVCQSLPEIGSRTSGPEP